MVRCCTKNLEVATEWLRRAESNLHLARLGTRADGILYEDFCFHCQQAAEKALKALLILRVGTCPKTHSLELLFTSLRASDCPIPEPVLQAVTLNDYAVSTRYPGEYEPVTYEELIEALETANSVVS